MYCQVLVCFGSIKCWHARLCRKHKQSTKEDANATSAVVVERGRYEQGVLGKLSLLVKNFSIFLYRDGNKTAK